jgi:triosephosphate isomerase
MPPRPLVAGNWKMNGLRGSLGILEAVVAGARALTGVDMMVFPPATLLATFAAAARDSPVAIGGQDCHALAAGPHTGDISAEMLRDAGARAVIVGHSERRQDHGETDAVVCAKAHAAHRAGLYAIICVGETRAERDDGQAATVVRRQLDGSVPHDVQNVAIAYEPVWAIGTGQTPTERDIADMHAIIRKDLWGRLGSPGQNARILYGGSVKPANAKVLRAIENVDGALVGGASLDAGEFLSIAAAYA